MARRTNLTGRQKAAVLLIALGPEYSAEILRHLDESQIEELTLEIASQERVSAEEREAIVREFYEMCLAQEYISHGGIEYARKVLEKAVGTAKAAEIINKLSAALKASPFDFIRNTDPEQLLNFISGENPQTIALIIAYLEPGTAAAVLSALPPEVQSEVALRLAIMGGTAPEIVHEVEHVLEKRLSSFSGQDVTAAGGVKSLVEVLNRVDRATEKVILERLEEQNPAIAEEVKKMLFVFEDITTLDDRAIQLVLREVDSKDLALALKATSEEVKARIFKNMSERAATMLREDMEYLGPVRLRNVEEAQQRIVTVIRRLEEAGEIIIARGKEDEIVV